MTVPPPLPIVDISGFAKRPQDRPVIGQAVELALMERGFMYVTGHHIDRSLVERAFQAMRWFFSQSQTFKNRYAYTDVDANFGYQGMEAERLDPGAMPDLKETFTMRNALQHADEIARWPAGDFRDIALALYSAGLGGAYRILEVLADRLQLPPDYFASLHRGENVTLRFLHYPAGQQVRAAAGLGAAPQLGAGAHTDYGSITLLFQDEVGGLELQGADGEWHFAPPVPGAAVINTGDLMERWTNGRYRSTVHRVRPITGTQDRYSIALFVDPDAAVEVECFASCVSEDRPLRYTRITAGEHIRRKIAATHEDTR